MPSPVISALQAMLNPDKPRTYVLQHAHCGHVALVSKRRATIEATRRTAHARGMHAWRARLEPKVEPTAKDCDRCRDDMKALSPKVSRRQAARAAKAARS